MVKLTDNEIDWLLANNTQMTYDKERSVLSGLFFINHSYNGITIKENFLLEVRFDLMKNREEYPKVYNIDGRIKNIARRKNMKNEDFHVYDDNSLCLGLPERFFEYYPDGFNLQTFFQRISEHLYWVAYLERYNIAPWPAELHGNDALMELLYEKADETLLNNGKFELLRKLHKEKLGRGITRSKLKSKLKNK